jgi:hemerythrin-like domain-containing protein
MILSHNSIIRGYNSIYQQAPRITTLEQNDFVGYCLAWHQFVEKHHNYEELYLFPAIEEAIGEKGVMSHEVAEHSTSNHCSFPQLD